MQHASGGRTVITRNVRFVVWDSGTVAGCEEKRKLLLTEFLFYIRHRNGYGTYQWSGRRGKVTCDIIDILTCDRVNRGLHEANQIFLCALGPAGMPRSEGSGCVKPRRRGNYRELPL